MDDISHFALVFQSTGAHSAPEDVPRSIVASIPACHAGDPGSIPGVEASNFPLRALDGSHHFALRDKVRTLLACKNLTMTCRLPAQEQATESWLEINTGKVVARTAEERAERIWERRRNLADTLPTLYQLQRNLPTRRGRHETETGPRPPRYLQRRVSHHCAAVPLLPHGFPK